MASGLLRSLRRGVPFGFRFVLLWFPSVFFASRSPCFSPVSSFFLAPLAAPWGSFWFSLCVPLVSFGVICFAFSLFFSCFFVLILSQNWPKKLKKYSKNGPQSGPKWAQSANLKGYWEKVSFLSCFCPPLAAHGGPKWSPKVTQNSKKRQQKNTSKTTSKKASKNYPEV